MNPDYSEAEKTTIKPSEHITVSEFADRHRVLLSQTSSEPGPWRTSRTPYLKDIMDSFNNPEIEEIVFCKPTQVGGTEMLYNCLGYVISQEPGPALMVMPTDHLAEYVSRNRIQPMIEASEVLKERKSSKQDEFKMLEMCFNGMVLSLGGSNSPATLASRPTKYLFLDEVDKYAPYVGREADPISLAYERTSTFWNRKIVIISTPTLEEGNIWTRLHKCQVVLYYYVPCPDCGHFQILIFEQVKWPKNKRDPDEVKNITWYECENCKAIIKDIQKQRMLHDGQWQPKGDALVPDKNVPIRSVGFHLNSLYSPWRSFGQVASEFLKSKDVPELLQNFRNSWQGLPWIEQIYKKESHDILKHCNSLKPLIVPNNTIALTAGVDPGQGGFWFVVLAWLKNQSVHIVHYGFLTSWEGVKHLLIDNTYQSELGEYYYPIWRSGIDTGGTELEDQALTMTEAAYMFLRKYQITGRIFGTKGRSTKTAQRMTLSIIDKMPGKNGTPIPGGLTIWLLSTDDFKDSLHYRLQVNIGDPGSVSLHSEINDDFVKHILAEAKRRDKKGQWKWIKVATRNDLLDAFVIALAMGDSACWGGLNVLNKIQAIKTQQLEPKKQRITENRQKNTNNFINNKGFLAFRSGWLSRG